MAFDTSSLKTASEPRAEKTERISPYLKVGSDPVVVRILSKNAFMYYRYWADVNIGTKDSKIIDGRPVITGMHSPMKTYMDSMKDGDPRFRRPSRRWVMNVLERKLDANGLPSNKVEDNSVKIWDFGAEVAKQLAHLDGRVRDRNKPSRQLSINEFDMEISTDGVGRDRHTLVQAHYDFDELVPELKALQVYDLEKMYAPFPNDVVQKIIDEEPYNDVMQEAGLRGEYPMTKQ